MYLSDFLLILVFLAFILYKVYKKQKANKEQKSAEHAEASAKALTAIESVDSAPLSEYCNRGVYRVDLIKLDSDLPTATMSKEIDTKLECLQACGTPAPKDVKAVMNATTLIIAFIWY